ncbi:MAG: NADH dehydrogenase-like protein [bacterium ADurb.Bin236]|nr:MAG: NADH dehydrogenase-like protein [bacterium ADurb.Bin236]HOY62292.1 FAD-dependent oxidoreductase [bacterium]
MAPRTVLIAGGGYAGSGIAAKLAALDARRSFNVVILDPSEFHVVKTRLHQIAVEPERDILIRIPTRTLADFARADFINSAVEKVDFKNRRIFANGSGYDWDLLVVATGAEPNYFGIPGAAEHSENILSYEAAMSCGLRIKSLGMNKRGASKKRIAVCGAGLLGVEFAAQLRQRYGPKKCEIVIIEKQERIIAASQCGDAQRDYISAFFKRENIKALTGTTISKLSPGRVCLEEGKHIDCDLTVWCGGIKRTGIGTAASGGLVVDPTLVCREHENVFGAGDSALVSSPLPNANSLTAQRAIYHADIAAKNIIRSAIGLRSRAARYKPKGELISLGDFDAVGVVSGAAFYGSACAAAKKANEMKYISTLFGTAINHIRIHR